MRILKALKFLAIVSIVYCIHPSARIAHATQDDCRVLTIMPVGDSRVMGERPNFESYRYELWALLVAHNAQFDFVGPFTDRSTYAEVNGRTFDRDHAGSIGYSSYDLLKNLDGFLKGVTPPDVVLLGIGGNDLIETQDSTKKIVGNIGRIVNIFRRANPQVTVLLEQIAPGHSSVMTPELKGRLVSLNRGVADLADEMSTPGSPIIVVDMYKGWSDRFMADDVHYNINGARAIAERYFSALQGLGVLSEKSLCE